MRPRPSLLDRGLAHLLASDAHTADVREAGLAGAVDALEDPDLARWLTLEMPMAIVTDAPVPRRPETKKRRFLRR